MTDLEATALVRRPARSLAEGLVTHIDRQPVSLDVADRQWEEYVAALEPHFAVREVAVEDRCPDSVFVEDTMVVVGDVAVIARPGAPSRRAEVAAAREAVTSLGLRPVELEPPATLEGGDVLKVGRTVYVGRSGRTNADGVRQLRAAVRPEGMTVVAVPVTRVLHLKSAVTALPDGSVVGYPPSVDDPTFFPHFRAVPEEAGAHVVVLDPQTVLMSAAAPQSAEFYSDLGFSPVQVDITEFEKLEGCVTCLSVRVRPPTSRTTP